MDGLGVIVTKRLHASGAFALASINSLLHTILAESVTAYINYCVFEVLSAVLAVCHSLS